MPRKTGLASLNKKQEKSNITKLVSVGNQDFFWKIDRDWSQENLFSYDKARYNLPSNLFRAPYFLMRFLGPQATSRVAAKWLLFDLKSKKPTEEGPIAWAEAIAVEQHFSTYEVTIGSLNSKTNLLPRKGLSMLLTSIFLTDRPDLIALFPKNPGRIEGFETIKWNITSRIWTPYIKPFLGPELAAGSSQEKFITSDSNWFDQLFAQEDREDLSYLETRTKRQDLLRKGRKRKGFLKRLFERRKKKSPSL